MYLEVGAKQSVLQFHVIEGELDLVLCMFLCVSFGKGLIVRWIIKTRRHNFII